MCLVGVKWPPQMFLFQWESHGLTKHFYLLHLILNYYGSRLTLAKASANILPGVQLMGRTQPANKSHGQTMQLPLEKQCVGH